jgi:hypothetical protein
MIYDGGVSEEEQARIRELEAQLARITEQRAAAGRIGGQRRAAKLSDRKRAAIARKAGRTRWDKVRAEKQASS